MKKIGIGIAAVVIFSLLLGQVWAWCIGVGGFLILWILAKLETIKK